MSSDITIRPFTGAEVERHIPNVARLRIEVFREFPYLYDGDMQYEATYLRTYSESKDSVIVLAFDADRIVGASTAVPLRHETDEAKRPFVLNGINPDDVFYLGESVLRKPYRGRGIGVRFFQEREAHARNVGVFRWFAFCAVERPDDHVRRPMNYVPLDQFWNHRGYRKHPELRTTFTWRDLDETEQTAKPMVFWMKPSSG